VAQAGLWIFTALATGEAVEVGRIAGCVFLAIVSIAAALGFLVYGGRLFLMLRRFPVESRGRTKKLREVCALQQIPATCESACRCFRWVHCTERTLYCLRVCPS
jgi:Protein of unknown function (DUF1084)